MVQSQITGIDNPHGTVQVSAPRGDAPNIVQTLGFDPSNGEPVVLAIGNATSDGAITTELGADANYADGSLYISATATGGLLYQKRNDVWTSV